MKNKRGVKTIKLTLTEKVKKVVLTLLQKILTKLK